ncbi:hypothetical protein Droror1_Dr00020456 [Drosera rotundifolia]
MALPLLAAAILYAGTVVLSTAVTHCPPCGNTTVPYPLSTGSNCGDQDYKVQCDAGTLKFPSANNSYVISSVDPDTQKIVIEPAEFEPGRCITEDITSVGVQLNSTLPFNITGDNTIMFLNCTDTLLQSPLNCSSNSLCHVYINNADDVAACENASICCTFRAGGSTTSYSITVRQAGCQAYRSFVDLDPSLPVSKWGNPGLEIQWLLPQEPVCSSQADCASDGGNSTCRVDPSNSGVSRCYCISGLFWDAIVGICARSKFLFVQISSPKSVYQ